jgi:hypothetical protein
MRGAKKERKKRQNRQKLGNRIKVNGKGKRKGCSEFEDPAFLASIVLNIQVRAYRKSESEESHLIRVPQQSRQSHHLG